MIVVQGEDCILAPKRVFTHLRLRWLDEYAFETRALQSNIEQLACQYEEQALIDPAILWRGVYYKRFIQQNDHEHVYIKWINQTLGFGLYAKKTLQEGDYIGVYLGVARAKPWYRDCLNSYCFTYPLQPVKFNLFKPVRWNIDAMICGNHTRFINHSEISNASTYAAYLAPYFYIIITASQPIMKDEQITYHYGSTYWRKRQDRLEN